MDPLWDTKTVTASPRPVVNNRKKEGHLNQCFLTSVSIECSTLLYVLMEFVCLTALSFSSCDCHTLLLLSSRNVLIGQIWDRYPPTARLTEPSAPRLRKGSPLPPHKCWPCRGITGGVISAPKARSDVPDLLAERTAHTAGAWTCGSLGSNYILLCSGLSIEQLCSQTKHCYCITVCRSLSSEMTQQLTVN